MSQFKVGDRVFVKVLSTTFGVGTIVDKSPTNFSSNWMILFDGSVVPQDVSPSWMRKLTKLEQALK